MASALTHEAIGRSVAENDRLVDAAEASFLPRDYATWGRLNGGVPMARRRVVSSMTSLAVAGISIQGPDTWLTEHLLARFEERRVQIAIEGFRA
jgi:hypothetical protein